MRSQGGGRIHGQFTPWTVHPLDSSPPGQFTPWTVHPPDSSPPGQFTPWTVHPLDSSPPGQFTLRTVHESLNYRRSDTRFTNIANFQPRARSSRSRSIKWNVVTRENVVLRWSINRSVIRKPLKSLLEPLFFRHNMILFFTFLLGIEFCFLWCPWNLSPWGRSIYFQK